MKGTIPAYTTTKKTQEQIDHVTATDLPGDKWALDVNIAGAALCLDGVNRDHVKATYPNATTEVYTYRLGGAAGTITETVTIVYTDATKDNLDTVDVVVF